MKAIKIPEARIAVRILAIAGFIILVLTAGVYIFLRIRAPHLMNFSHGIEEIRIETDLDSLKNAFFIQGMKGCENIFLVEDTTTFYVTTLEGKILMIDGPSPGDLEIKKSVKVGTAVSGITEGPDNLLYIGVSQCPPDEWTTTGGSVYFITKHLDSLAKLTGNYPSLNGIACDNGGNLYFASCNFKIFNPEGSVYVMHNMGDAHFEPPVKFIDNIGLANGIYFDRNQDLLYFSNTVEGVYSFRPEMTGYEEVYLKLRFMEACDDLCTDIAGNVWMTDPGQSTIKVFNPGTSRLIRFVIKDIGQTSSARIRSENGREMLYITELNQRQAPSSKAYDGRGVLIVPAQELLQLTEKYLRR